MKTIYRNITQLKKLMTASDFFIRFNCLLKVFVNIEILHQMKPSYPWTRQERHVSHTVEVFYHGHLIKLLFSTADRRFAFLILTCCLLIASENPADQQFSLRPPKYPRTCCCITVRNRFRCISVVAPVQLHNMSIRWRYTKRYSRSS